MTYGYQAGYRPPTQPQSSGRAQVRQVPYVPPAQQRRGGGGGGGGGNGRPPQQPPRPPSNQRNKKKKGRGALSFFLILLLLALIVVGTYGYVLNRDLNGQGEVFYQGVYVGGLHIGGMTRDQAAQALSNLESEQLGQWSATLVLGDKGPTITAADIDLRLDLQDQLDAAWLVGRTGGPLQRQQTIRSLREEPYYTTGGITYNEQTLDGILQSIKLGFDRPAVNATSSFDASLETPLQYTHEENGRSLNVEPLKEDLATAITTLQPVTLQMTEYISTVEPTVTVAMLQGDMSHIVTVRTTINPNSTDNRNENIRVACQRLDGLRLVAGERLSFNKVAMARTEKNGYKEAQEIVYGEYRMGIGGGVCQVSTTLYQAVLRAGLEVVEHEYHAQSPNYSEKGQDATVADNRVDFVFKNNTGADLHIAARLVESSDGKTKYCEISLYGKPFSTEYTYALETRLVEEIPIPTEPIQVADKEKYIGQEEVVDKGRKGYRVEVYRLTMKDGMAVGEPEYIDSAYYKEKAPTVKVGTKARE